MPNNQPDEEIITIAQEISAYLTDHPNAADSLEGVVNWWLTRQRYEQVARKVQKALDYLVTQGVVTASTIASGETVYSIVGRPPKH